MKIKGLLILVFVFTFGALTVFAQNGKKMTITGTDYFDPFGILGSTPVGEILSSDATIICPGHVPTGDPLQPCPAGSRTHTRGLKIRTRFISTTEGLSDGWFTITLNSNLDADFTGPSWGTYSLAYDSGGVMEGTWQGKRYKEGDYWVSPLHVTGHVTGGEFDGANFVGTDRIVSYTPIVIAYIGTVEGRLILAGSKK
jgi:hypothetical protein